MEQRKSREHPIQRRKPCRQAKTHGMVHSSAALAVANLESPPMTMRQGLTHAKVTFWARCASALLSVALGTAAIAQEPSAPAALPVPASPPAASPASASTPAPVEEVLFVR